MGGVDGPDSPEDVACLRIGELARRTGVSVATLRAWERRYRILEPQRTSGGHRLYRLGAVEVVRTVRALIDRGWAVAAACEQVREHGPAPVVDAGSARETVPAPMAVLRERLWESLGTYDGSGVHEVLDRALLHHDRLSVIDGLVAPVLRRLGEGWEDDPGVVSQEHAGTHLLRSRLLVLLAPTDAAPEHDAVAFCVQDELHDLGLLMASVAVATAGWRPLYLGSQTPWEAAAEAVGRTRPGLLLVASSSRGGAERFLREVAVGDDVVVALGGAGFTSEDAGRLPTAFHHDGALRDLPARIAQLRSTR